MKIVNNTITFSPTVLPIGIVGLDYYQEITMTGGTEGYNPVTVENGSLPEGLTISSNSNKIIIQGNPTSPYVGNFTIVERGGQDICGFQEY